MSDGWIEFATMEEFEAQNRAWTEEAQRIGINCDTWALPIVHKDSPGRIFARVKPVVVEGRTFTLDAVTETKYRATLKTHDDAKRDKFFKEYDGAGREIVAEMTTVPTSTTATRVAWVKRAAQAGAAAAAAYGAYELWNYLS